MAHSGRGPGEPIARELRTELGLATARRRRVREATACRSKGPAALGALRARPAWLPEVGREAMWSGVTRRIDMRRADGSRGAGRGHSECGRDGERGEKE